VELAAEIGTGRIIDTAWSADGRWVAVATGAGVHVYDGLTGAKTAYVPTDKIIFRMALSPDGRTLALVMEGGGDYVHPVSFWDVASGEKLAEVVDETYERSTGVFGLDFSPDGKRLVASQYLGRLAVVDGKTGQLLLEMASQGLEPVFSPDGKRLAARLDGQVLVFDAATGDELHRFAPKIQPVERVEFSPDGETLAVLGSRLSLYSLSGELRLEPQSANHVQGKIVFSSDGRLVAVGGRVWDAATGERARAVNFRAPEAMGGFNPSLTRAVSFTADQVTLWDGETGAELATLLDSLFVEAWAFSPDSNRLALVGWDQEVRIWDLEQGELAASRLSVPSQFNHVLAFSPDGGTIAVGGDSYILVSELGSTIQPLHLEGHLGVTGALVFSPDGRTLYSGSRDEGPIIQWDLASGTQIQTLEGHLGVTQLILTQDGGRLISVGHEAVYTTPTRRVEDPTPLRIWDTATGELLRAVDPLRGRIASVHLSPDETWLALYGPGARLGPQIVDLASGQMLEEIEGPPVIWDYGLALHPSGRILAISANREIYLWDLRAREFIAQWTGNLQYLDQMEFSPDGRWLATNGSDGVLRVWEIISQ
jgi:WD40 repeat protein